MDFVLPAKGRTDGYPVTEFIEGLLFVAAKQCCKDDSWVVRSDAHKACQFIWGGIWKFPGPYYKEQ